MPSVRSNENMKKHGIPILAAGVLLAIAGLMWAYAPTGGLCLMDFRSVDSYHITLTSPPVTVGSAWDRTSAWALDETIMRTHAVLVALLAYNIVGLIYLRRKRNAANKRMEGTAV